MKKVLITGATGNVGMEVIKSLLALSTEIEIIAGVRDLEKDATKFVSSQVSVRKFDFEAIATFQAAFSDCDVLFLLRPPQLADTEKYFKPLIESLKNSSIQHIVFLSVQGVEKSSIIPHFRIEKLIREQNMTYTFLRPAYFMQNFITTLKKDLIEKKLIFLPAGNAVFTVVDVRDIGAVAAKIIIENDLHQNAAYELTNSELLMFSDMANQLSDGLNEAIRYESPSLLRFYLAKRKEHVAAGYILVLILLHYLPRFQKTPSTTDWIEKITNKKPFTFKQFIRDNIMLLQSKTV